MERTPTNRPFASRRGVLSHWQMMVRPSLVTFSCTLWAAMSPSATRSSGAYMRPRRFRHDHAGMPAPQFRLGIAENTLGRRIHLAEAVLLVVDDATDGHPVPLHAQPLLALAERLLGPPVLVEIVADLILALATAKGRAHRAEERGQVNGAVEHEHVRKGPQGLHGDGRVGPSAGQEHQRQVGPVRLAVQHGGQGRRARFRSSTTRQSAVPPPPPSRSAGKGPPCPHKGPPQFRRSPGFRRWPERRCQSARGLGLATGLPPRIHPYFSWPLKSLASPIG